MTDWPDAKRIDKPCTKCGEPMWCTPNREICSKCRKVMEKEGAARRRKEKAARLITEKADPDRSAA